MKNLFDTRSGFIDKFLDVFLDYDLGLLWEWFFDDLGIRESDVREGLRHAIFFDEGLGEAFNTVEAFGRETGDWELHELLNCSTGKSAADFVNDILFRIKVILVRENLAWTELWFGSW